VPVPVLYVAVLHGQPDVDYDEPEAAVADVEQLLVSSVHPSEIQYQRL
jgi:hypothetical protein